MQNVLNIPKVYAREGILTLNEIPKGDAPLFIMFKYYMWRILICSFPTVYLNYTQLMAIIIIIIICASVNMFCMITIIIIIKFILYLKL